MGKSSSNENMLKLRELTEKMCVISNDNTSEEILKEVKTIVEEGSEKIKVLSNTQTKIKNYENMFAKIILVLNNIKL